MTYCRARFRNLVPGQTITRTLATFFFDDGTESSDGPGDVVINYTEAGYRFPKFQDKDKCCVKVFLFMTWLNGSGGDTPVVESGFCFTEVGLDLVPKTQVAKGTLDKAPSAQLAIVNLSTGESTIISGEVPEEYRKYVDAGAQ